MEIIMIFGAVAIYVITGWLFSKIAMPILNFISLILIGETIT